MHFKKSKFNLFVPYNNNQYIVFNTFSGAIGMFNSDTMQRYENNELSEEEVATLIRKGVYIPSMVNEIDKICKDRTDGIFRKEKYVRIWPTSGCNARCYYCFENDIPVVHMSEETADDVVGFIDELLSQSDNLTIEWFGGEPLVNPHIIDWITRKLKPVCNAKKVDWHSFIISNGSLINDTIADKFKMDWNISSAQITLDGYEKEYERIKNYKNPSSDNFHHVIANIWRLLRRGIYVTIRMNYDTTNYETLRNLIEFLHTEFGNNQFIHYYIYPVWDALNNTSGGYTTATKADSNLIALFDLLIKFNMTSIRRLARLNYKKHQCISCSVNSFTIFPNGDIGKCSETFIQTIGNVKDGIVNEEVAIRWTNTDISKDCENCIYLPLCQGGCRSSQFTKMPKCFAFKEIIPDLIRWYADHMEVLRQNITSKS